MDIENAVLVSPFKGIDPTFKYRGKLYETDKYPSHWKPGKGDEAADNQDYLASVERAINGALNSDEKFLA